MRKFLLLLALVLPVGPATADDDLTRLQIHVTNARGKPVDRASVIVKFVNGRSVKALGLKKARLSWELKSSQEGMAKIPGIPKGKILIQEYMAPPEFGQLIRSHIANWGKVIKENNIHP